jgi:iron complex outermembrane receptor protein
MRKRRLYVSVVAIYAAFGGVASAQAVDPDAGQGFNDIVVTAQRREQKLQDVPASVTSLSGDTLLSKGVQNTQDLTIAVPGLFWARSTNFNQPTIRGVGNRNSAPGDEPNVATYLDGVYQPDQIGTLFELSGVERVEVLKGPQGTLFGRNATGGVIKIVTKKPSFNFSGSASASYGSFGYKKGTFYATGPIIPDRIAASIAAVAFGDDGYVKNLYLGNTMGKSSGLAIRPKLYVQISDDVTLELNGLYTKSNNNVLLAGYALDGNSIARVVVSRPAINTEGLTLDQALTSRPYTTTSATSPVSKISSNLVDAHLKADLGFATLSGVLAYGHSSGFSSNVSDASPFALSMTQYDLKAKYLETEWVLTSPDEGNFTWIAGAQAFKGDAGFTPVISTTKNSTTGVVTVTRQSSGQRTRAWSAFAEATYKITPKFDLTAGLRYSWDEKDGFQQTNSLPQIGLKASFDNFSPRVVAKYEFSPDANAYASFTKGYKSGIINISAAGAAKINPEIITAYEVGFKSTLGRRVRLSLAAFHYDYKDLQIASFVFVNNVSTSTVQNAGSVKINGFEGNATVLVADGFTVDASVSVLDTKIGNFPNAVVQVPNGVNIGNRTIAADVNGNELIRAPDYTFSIGATYEHKLGSGSIVANATAFFSGEYFAEVSNRVKQPAYKVVNASVRWNSGGGYYLSVFGQNLTNQIYASGFFVSTFLDNTQASKPRWFGGTVGYEF